MKDIHSASLLNFVFQCIKGQSIPAFENYFMTNGAVSLRVTRNENNIVTYRCNKNIRKNTIHHQSASLWNAMSGNIEAIENKNEFKHRIFNKLISEY